MECSEVIQPTTVAHQNCIRSTPSSTSSTGKKISFIDQSMTIQDRYTWDQPASDPSKSLILNTHVFSGDTDTYIESQQNETDSEELLNNGTSEELLNNGTNEEVDMPPSYSEVMNPGHSTIKSLPHSDTPQPSPSSSTNTLPSTSNLDVNPDNVVLFDIVTE